MSSAEDDRKLIQIVEYHQVLWDNRLKGFRDKKLTTHAWQSVAELLERDVGDVMQRWGSLRKQYSRKVTQQRQKSGADSPEKQWHLQSYMSFLRPCITPRKPPLSSQQPDYASTEDISSSSMSDGDSESSPLVIQLNPAETESNESQEKKPKIPKLSSPVSSTITTKRTFRSVSIKSKEQNRILPVAPPAKPSTTVRPLFKEQSDNESVSGTVVKMSAKQSVLKSVGLVSKSQSADVKPVVRPPEMKIKKLKTSADGSASKSTTNDNCSASRIVTPNPKSFEPKSYDADEFFLLSLAPDLRRLSPRQKYEAKSKMLDIVSEQYLKS